jgi:hypothetical protein
MAAQSSQHRHTHRTFERSDGEGAVLLLLTLSGTQGYARIERAVRRGLSRSMMDRIARVKRMTSEEPYAANGGTTSIWSLCVTQTFNPLCADAGVRRVLRELSAVCMKSEPLGNMIIAGHMDIPLNRSMRGSITDRSVADDQFGRTRAASPAGVAAVRSIMSALRQVVSPRGHDEEESGDAVFVQSSGGVFLRAIRHPWRRFMRQDLGATLGVGR